MTSRLASMLRATWLTLPVVVGVVAAFELGAPARADTLTWWATGSTGSAGGTGTWDTTNARWTADGSVWSPWVNANIDTAVFAGTAGTVTLSEGITVGGLTFTTTGYTVTGNTLTLSGGTAAVSAGSGVTATIGSTISGTAVLQKTGVGTLSLSTANNYTGGTLLSQGLLELGDNSALGTGTLTFAGGAIRPTANRVVSNAIVASASTSSNLIDGGAGDLMYTGTGTGSGTLVANSTTSRSMWLQGDWSGFTGEIQVVVNQGGTNYRLGGSPGTTTQSSGTNASDFSQTKFVLSGDGVNRGLSWNGLDGATVQVGELSGSGGRIIAPGRSAIWQVGALNTSSTAAVVIEGATTGLTKVGTGTLTLTGASSYSGTTTVNAGVLRMGNRNAFGAFITGRPVTQVIVSAGGAIDLNGVVDATYGYTISGSGATGAGAIVNNGGNIGTGSAQMSNLRLAADATIGGTGNFGLLTNSFGATSLDLNGRTLTKAGSNIFFLTNTTVTAGSGGAIRVSGGTFSLDAGGAGTGWTAAGANLSGVAFSLDNVAGAGLVLNNIALSLGSLSGGGATGGNVTLGSGTLTVGALGTSTTYSGAIGGTGGLVKTGSGTLTLDRASGFTGPVTVNSGTLRIGVIGAFGPENTAVTKVVVNAGGAIDLGGINDVAYGYTISGSGASGAGAIVNTGGGIGTGIKQTSNIRLAADAAIGGSGNWALLTGGYNATSLDLGGFTLTKTGSNTISLVNTTATSGTILIAAGTLSQANRDNNLASVAFTLDDVSGASLALNDRAMTIGSLSGGGATGGNVALGIHTLTTGGLNTSTAYGGAIGGSGSLIKAGTGTMALGGVSTYTGSTTIRAGALVANANAPSAAVGAFGNTSGAIVVGDGSTGAADAPSLLVGGAFTVGRAVSIGSVSNGNAYTAVLGGTNESGTGAFSGAITLATTASTYTGVELRAAAGGTVDFTGAWTTNDKPITVGSAGNTGTVRLSSALATTAGVSVNAGTLQVGATTALGSTTPVTLAAATTLDMNGLAATIGTLAGSGTVAGGAGSVLTVTQAGSGSFAGVITGDVGLTKVGAGQLTLGGVSSTTGPITVSTGTLAIASGGSVAASTLTVANAASLTGAGTGGATTVLDGGILAPGTAGAGTLTLTSLTFGSTAGNAATVSIPATGLTTIPAAIQVNGDVITNGGAGSVTFAFGSLSLVPTGTYPLITSTGSFASGTAPFAYTASTGGRQGVSFENAANALNLVISNAFPVWSGADGSGWTTSDNWRLNTDDAPTSFLPGDTVVFNDSGVTGGVTISGADVSPITTTFSANTLAYTLDSTGGFGIAAGNLVKSGSATVTIANSNSFDGGTLVSAGSLLLTGAGGLGSGAVTVSGGSLVLTNAGGLGSGPVAVSGGRFAVTGAGALGGNTVSLESGTIEVGSDTALGSGTLSLSGGVLSSDSPTARVIGNPVVVGGNTTLGSGANTGHLTFSGAFDLGGTTRSLTTPSDVTLSGLVGNGGLTKGGGGALTITGSNSYSGGTTLSAGRIRLGNDAALGSGGITLSSGTLSSDSTAARTLANAVIVAGDVSFGDATNTGLLTFAGTVNLGGATRQVTTLSSATISGSVVSGGLAKAGAGVLTLSASNSYAGGTTLSAGTLRVGNNAALGTGTVALDGGTLSSDSATPRSLSNLTAVGGDVVLGDSTNSGALTLSGAMNLGSSTRELTTASDVTISGVISGGAGVGLTKDGPGTLTLSAANTYGGTTTVAGGTVKIGNMFAFGPRQTGRPVTQVVVNPGGTVDFNGTVDPIYGYTISGSGADGTGALVNNGAAISDFTAQTTNISLAGDAAIGGTANWGILTTGYAATSLDLNGFTLTKLGSNRISLTNTTILNTGTIAVASGTFALNAAATTGTAVTIVLANATNVGLDLNGQNLTIGALSGGGASGGNVSLGTGILAVGSLNTSTTYAGVISGGGGIAKGGTGTLTLTGANTFTGGVSSNGGGVLEVTTIADGAASSIGAGGFVGIADSSTFRYTGSANVTTTRNLWMDTGVGASVIDIADVAATLTWNPAGGTRNKDFLKAGPGTLALGGAITGTAAVTVDGGSLVLSAVNTYSGATTVAAGTLALAGGGGLASASIDVAGGARFDVSALAGGFTVGSGQELRGAGTILGSLLFGADSRLAFSSSLVVDSGTVSFAGFGIDDIVGLDGTLVNQGTYTLLGGTANFDLTGALNVGFAQRVGIGGGKEAYFQQGSLQVIVVPEPGVLVLTGVGLAVMVLASRRRRTR